MLKKIKQEGKHVNRQADHFRTIQLFHGLILYLNTLYKYDQIHFKQQCE